MSFAVKLVWVATVTLGSFSSMSAQANSEAEPIVVKTSEESFNVVSARVAGLEAKIVAANVTIKTLLEEKKKTKDPERLKSLVADLNSEHKKLQEIAKEFDQQRNLLKYRYPDKDTGEKRTYQRTEVKSLDQMEQENSLSKKVNVALDRVRQQYPGNQEQAADTQESYNPGKAATEPVIIKK